MNTYMYSLYSVYIHYTMQNYKTTNIPLSILGLKKVPVYISQKKKRSASSRPREKSCPASQYADGNCRGTTTQLSDVYRPPDSTSHSRLSVWTQCPWGPRPATGHPKDHRQPLPARNECTERYDRENVWKIFYTTTLQAEKK